jgi:ribosomal protein S18 acetylase RimI-like enzyme
MFEIAKVNGANEILELQNMAYQSEAAIYNDYTITPLKQTLEDMIDDLRKQIVLKAVKDGKIIGSVRGRIRENTGYIGRLIVHPDFQNQGLGSHLLQEIEGKLHTAERFELFTGHKSERNLHLYQKSGYKPFRSEIINDRLTQVYLEKRALDHLPMIEPAKPNYY